MGEKSSADYHGSDLDQKAALKKIRFWVNVTYPSSMVGKL